jgi:hypothetical protein
MLAGILQSVFVKTVLKKVLSLASPNPKTIIGILESWNPEIKQKLSQNDMWNSLKTKSPQEIEAYAASLIKNPQVVTGFLESLSPGLAQKVQNNPFYRNLQTKSSDEIGQMVNNFVNTSGFFRR